MIALTLAHLQSCFKYTAQDADHNAIIAKEIQLLVIGT